MVRAAPFVFLPDGNLEDAILPELRGPDAERRMDKAMAELAIAFAHDIDLANASEEPDDKKWPIGLGIGFAILASAALWAAIAGLITLI